MLYSSMNTNIPAAHLATEVGRRWSRLQSRDGQARRDHRRNSSHTSLVALALASLVSNQSWEDCSEK